jgi:flagellar basal body-associated protein FliL
MDEIRFNKPIIPGESKVPEENEQKTGPNNRKIWQKMKKQSVFLAIMLLVIIILIGVAVNFYFKAKNLQVESQMATAGETQKIVEEVSKLIILPGDEVPTVATVQDPTKLRGQPFFANAKEGNKVLIYTKARKAILYDPVKKIIVEVAPLNSGATENLNNKMLP